MTESDDQADFAWLTDGARQQREWTAAVEKLFRESGGGNDTLRRAAGEMHSYKSHHKAGSGQELFRAYLGYRALVKDAEAQRGADLEQSLQYAMSREPQPYVDALTEQLGIEVLVALDAVIEDLAKFCDRPGPVDDQLPNIRSALRLEGARSPHSVVLRRQRQEAKFLWVRLYIDAIERRPYRRRSDMAVEIMKTFGISRTAALNCAPAIDSQLPQILKRRTPPRQRATKPAAQRSSLKYGSPRR